MTGSTDDDAPELTEDWFARALLMEGERIILPRYAVLIDGSAGAYGVVVPDLPGCTAMGETIDDALHNVALAATDWLKDAASSGAVIPPARAVDVLRTDREVTVALTNGALLAAMPEYAG